MSLLDEIKRDMEQGTPGPWHTSDLDAREIEAEDGKALGGAYGRDDETFANASRCARVPDMEKALLAAEELAKAAESQTSDGWPSISPWTAAELAAFRAATE